jgi:hypothetical protein
MRKFPLFLDLTFLSLESNGDALLWSPYFHGVFHLARYFSTTQFALKDIGYAFSVCLGNIADFSSVGISDRNSIWVELIVWLLH